DDRGDGDDVGHTRMFHGGSSAMADGCTAGATRGIAHLPGDRVSGMRGRRRNQSPGGSRNKKNEGWPLRAPRVGLTKLTRQFSIEHAILMSYAAYLAAPERRRRILECAKDVFSRRGYHETNISHICEAMGIARGTLYQYFTSKKDVFAAIVEEMLTRVREAVAREPVVRIPPGFRPTRDQVLQYTASSLQRVLEAVFA